MMLAQIWLKSLVNLKCFLKEVFKITDLCQLLCEHHNVLISCVNDYLYRPSLNVNED